MKSQFAVATYTLIRTEAEGKIVTKTIEELSKLNIPVIIVDGGSPEKDITALKQLPNIFLYEGIKEWGKQIIISNKEAAKKADYVFFLQSDKLEFVKNYAGSMLETYEKLQTKGICIASRSREAQMKYPQYQRIQEEFMNFFIGDYIGIKQDYFSGVRIYPSSLVKYLQHIKGDIAIGVESYLYALAKRLKLPFSFITYPIMSPPDTDNEEIAKQYRLKITQWEIEGFLQGM